MFIHIFCSYMGGMGCRDHKIKGLLMAVVAKCNAFVH